MFVRKVLCEILPFSLVEISSTIYVVLGREDGNINIPCWDVHATDPNQAIKDVNPEFVVNFILGPKGLKSLLKILEIYKDFF